MKKADTIAALAAAAMLGLGGAAFAQSGAASPPISGQSGASSGSSMQRSGTVEDEIKTQLLAMGYTDVGQVKESQAGVYETKAKRNGQLVMLRIDAKSGEIRESKG
jgi:hypothetical protein